MPTWTDLRDLGNSKPAKWSFAFPVVGYALLFNSWIDAQLVALGLPETMATIPYVYFGLLFFSIASIIFSTFCPREIKSYPDVRAFISATDSTISAAEVADYCTVVSDFSTDAGVRDSAKGVYRVVMDGGLAAAVAGKVLDVRKSYFHILNQRHDFWRGSCALFYVLGFGAFLFVTVSGIYSVLVSIM